MNEGTKTGIFWAIAAVMVAVAAMVAWPRPEETTQLSSMVGQELFEDFKDPLAAASMKVVSFDAELGRLKSFEVAKDRATGVWSIPSRQGYPADGTEQMKQAATALLGLKILDVKSDNPEDHDEFGVIEPDVEELAVGDDGVGRLIEIENESGDTLVSLIIGDTPKDAPTHRYVRVSKQDPIYEVELDDTPLTTKFSEWIEDDLLQLSSLDIAGISIRKYTASAGLTATGQLGLDQQRAYDADLTLDETNQWLLDRLYVYDGTNTATEKTLTPDEVLSTTSLNALKNALDDLKIVDVMRKPEGMSADLKADKSILENAESLQSLLSNGFIPVQSGNAELEIIASNGELIVDLRDGVQYALRFGKIAGIESEDDDDAADDPNNDADVQTGAERYLLVTTRVNEQAIPRPAVRPVPESLEELAAQLNPADPAESPGPVTINPLSGSEPAASTPEAAGGESNESESPTATDTSEGTVEAEGEGTTTSEGEATGSGGGQEPGQQPPAESPAENTDPASQPPADNAAPTAETQEGDTADPATQEPAEETPAAEEQGNPWDDMTDEEKAEYLEAEQEKIKKENQRVLDEWNAKIEDAQRRVKALNARFADWYYIIPESTFADLQFPLDKLLEKPGAAPAGQALPGASGLPQFNFPGAP